MKFCAYCGTQLYEDALVCVRCGRRAAAPSRSHSGTDDTLQLVVKIFLIIGCVTQGWMLIPLAWCIPMTVSIFKSFKTGQPVSMAMKICTLLFVSLVSGVCLLCMDNDFNI